MSNYEALRRDQAVVEHAAANLRHSAIQQAYAGAERPDRAFAMALVLDELGRHLNGLDQQCRGAVVDACATLIEPEDEAKNSVK